MNPWTRRPLGPIDLHGDPEPELLLVPGAGEQAATFRDLVQALSIPAAAVDLPGHGAQAGALLTSVEEMAEAMEAGLRELGRSVVLLGHSMGGAVTIRVALRRAVGLRGIILYSTGARLRVSPMIFGALERLYDLRTRDSVRGFFGPAVTEEVLDAYLALPRHPTNAQALTDFRAADRFDEMASVGDIALPALVLGGDSDVLTPPKYQAWLAEKIPGARRVILAGCGHVGHMERPGEVLSAVESFVGSLA